MEPAGDACWDFHSEDTKGEGLCTGAFSAPYRPAFMMLSAVAPPEKRTTPEQDFWDWFQANEETLFIFTPDLQEALDRIDRINAKMRNVHSSMCSEVGLVLEEGGKRELIISADGNPDAFPAVESLFSQAPKLDRWIWVKFKPRRTPEGMMIRHQGVSLKFDDVFFAAEANDGKVDINLYIRHYQLRHEQAYQCAAILMLDNTLGECDSETKVGFIETRYFSDRRDPGRKPLKELPTVFDDLIARQKGV
jgi:hypothetical protein